MVLPSGWPIGIAPLTGKLGFLEWVIGLPRGGIGRPRSWIWAAGALLYVLHKLFDLVFEWLYDTKSSWLVLLLFWLYETLRYITIRYDSIRYVTLLIQVRIILILNGSNLDGSKFNTIGSQTEYMMKTLIDRLVFRFKYSFKTILWELNYIIGIIQVKLQSKSIIVSLKLKYELIRFATIVKKSLCPRVTL